MTPPKNPSTAATLSFSDGTLLLSGWHRVAIEKVFGPDIWVWDERVGAWRCEAFRYPQIEATLRAGSIGTSDRVAQWQTVNWSQVNLPPMRPEQQTAIDAWLKQPNGVIVMPTGTGKTEVALRIMAETRSSTLIVAPIRDLMYQWHQRILRSFNYDAGIIGDSTFNVKAVSVTTYDSACIHAPKLGNRFKLLIFDECHHLPGAIRRDAARMSIATMRLGLTATPERADGKHSDLEFLIGPVVYRLDIGEVRGKSLAEYAVYRIPIHLSEEEQSRYDRLSTEVRDYFYDRKKAEPDFTWEKLCKETGTDVKSRRALKSYREKQSIEDRAEEKLRILEDLFRLHQGTPMVVFVGSNAMARDVSRRFLIPCLLNHCGKKERLDYLEGLRDGVYPAIVANQVLDEGVDIPAVKIAIVIGGMASTKQAKQRLGRILRRSGTHQATMYEVVCQDTNEAIRSRKRRDSDAYSGTRHRRL